MGVAFTPPSPAAEVTGIDLREPANAEDVTAIDNAMATYGVLVFRSQDIDAEQHSAFTKNWLPDAGLTLAIARKPRLENTDVIDLANFDESGEVLPVDNARTVSHR